MTGTRVQNLSSFGRYVFKVNFSIINDLYKISNQSLKSCDKFSLGDIGNHRLGSCMTIISMRAQKHETEIKFSEYLLRTKLLMLRF